MLLQELLFHRFRTVGRLGRLLIATCVVACFNFVEPIVRDAARTVGTYVADGYVITVCRIGPPPGLRPRFLITCSLLIATIGVFRRSFPSSRIVVAGVLSALAVYGYWWIESYRVFLNFTDADIYFINHPEIKQTAYLYSGTWLDVGVAASVVICSVLFLDRLFNQPHSGANE